MPKISIAIPSYEYGGKGVALLQRSFKILSLQLFNDFNIVIADQSAKEDRKIEELCDKWSDRLDIKYINNSINRGNAPNNFNVAMYNSDGEYIKLLCQDDYLFGNNALLHTNNTLSNNKTNWLASAYWHGRITTKDIDKVVLENIHYPSMNERIYIVNTLGTPSGITIRNYGKELPSFDPELAYCYDCDFYYKYYQLFGCPFIFSMVTVVNVLWSGSVTSNISSNIIEKENRYILQKYGFDK